MTTTTTKPAYTVRWKDEENERNLRKLFFAAAPAIPDQMLSNLAQLLYASRSNYSSFFVVTEQRMRPAEHTYHQTTRRKTIGCRLTAISWSP